MAFKGGAAEMNTILGEHSAFDGAELRVAGSLHIAGDVAGDVMADGNVVISSTARVQGNVSAASVVVGGIVTGDIVAPNGVTLLSTAVVLGNVATNALQVEDGTVLNGSVRQVRKASGA